MAETENIYEAVCRLLTERGIAVLCKGQAPANPANLFDLIMARGGPVSVHVDDAFVEEMRRRAGS